RQLLHFLIDHLQYLKPDIVVFMPVNNDLTDTFGVTEGGHRALMPDVAQPDPYLSVHDEPLIGFITRALEAARAKGVALELGPDAAGAKALTADLSAESQRRYDAAAESIALLQRVLQQVDARLLLAFHEEDAYGWTLRARLLAAHIDGPSVPLFSRIPRAYRLPDDSHPSPEGQSFMARWIADDLLRRGWVDGGAGQTQPPLPEELLSYRAVEPTPADVLEKANEASNVARDLLQSRIDLSTGQGIYQIYGGLNQDGSMGSALSAVLASGAALEVTLAPEPKVAQLYPLRVDVSLDGVVVGELLVPARGECRGVFSRPEGADETLPIECKLSPELWGVSLAFGRSQVTSCRVLSVDSLPD
ncbi:MAG: lysophospholipase L1-like esterase, partial [Pseudohongiellaceae bacterium]